MGNDLFGIDIAGLIADSITADDVLPATLLRETEAKADPDDLTAPPDIGTLPIPCRGFTETLTINDNTSTDAIEDDRKVSIVGGSLPAGIVPSKGDKLRIKDMGENVTFTVLGILQRDPAGAMYVLHVRR